MRADDQTVQIAGQDPHGVFNAFSPPDLRAGLVEYQGVSAQFPDSHLEGHPCSGAVLVEEHSPILAGEVGAGSLSPVLLEEGSMFENLDDFVSVEIAFRQKMFHSLFLVWKAVKASSVTFKAFCISASLAFKGGRKRIEFPAAPTTSNPRSLKEAIKSAGSSFKARANISPRPLTSTRMLGKRSTNRLNPSSRKANPFSLAAFTRSSFSMTSRTA